MVKISLASAVLALTTVSVAQASFLSKAFEVSAKFLQQDPSTPVNKFDEPHMKYYLACGSGYMGGLISGFYANKSETVSAQCMGQSTLDSINDFKRDITSGHIQQIFQSFNVFYQAAFQVQTQCRMNEVQHEVMAFCLDPATPGNCSFNTLQQNFLGNLFKITAALNYIASDIVQEYTTNVDITKVDLTVAKADWQNLGEQVGAVVRTVFGYTSTIGKPVKPIN